MTSMPNQVSMNRTWAKLTLEALVRHGVTDICIAPGSRSTPLTLEAGERSDLTVHTHFDERGLGFLALGLAKASQKPVAVVVTSGTAVANLLPAVAEAGLTREKLVMLTADRPVELIDCGANQAIDQYNIFGSHAVAAVDLPSPSVTVPACWLLTTIDNAMAKQARDGGAVHFNCRYPEPLYGDVSGVEPYLEPVSDWLGGGRPYLEFPLHSTLAGVDLNEWETLQKQKGILIAGRLSAGEFAHVEALSKTLGWPLLADPQSSGGTDWQGYDSWLQHVESAAALAEADVVVQFGARLVSKRLGQFIAGFNGTYWIVDPHPGRLDCAHRPAVRIRLSAGDAACVLAEDVRHVENAGWADSLKSVAAKSHKLAQAYAQERLTEIGVASRLPGWLDDQTDLFLGNSLAIRLVDMFSRIEGQTVFANRGASGIDGLFATAAGVQRARMRKMCCLIGDTSALYDLNSLALLRQQQHPIAVVLFNNDGGGIFDMLPVPGAQKDQFYRMPHQLDFSHAAAMFGLGYCRPESLAEMESMLGEAMEKAGTTLIEVVTPPGEAGEMMKQLFSAVKQI
ncbi:2-succinyl-5-enolpyruvyl-6-hydroxy-3-cyclohexene-1-carboxylic-acid synthase [Parasalinivibrio latis]|uniref:2-succinyl-5-enolpyruvyl-6-hydroxy-3- cyclohexene-1-carboxylic-acid synthase n=1 Tax=Parasalinivibrio latis TaxID=2952610 RepID=UPI0030E19895